MWQMGFENKMQSESHKERLSMYVTRQLLRARAVMPVRGKACFTFKE